MVRVGISEGWGGEIRGALGASLDNRFKALLSGLGVTMLLQSSSATALLTSSFTGQGILTTATALAIMLGADVGTTLVAQILTFDFSALSPLMIAFGVALFTYSPGGRRRDDHDYDSGLSAMQLDVLRDLKRVSSHLASVAYPILEEAGQLRSPLRRNKSNEKAPLRRIDDSVNPSAT